MGYDFGLPPVRQKRLERLDVPRVTPEPALELLGGHRTPGPPTPLLLGPRDPLRPKPPAELLEAALTRDWPAISHVEDPHG